MTTITPHAKWTASDGRPRRWSGEEYLRLAKLGFFDGQRVELIDGAIIEMSPIFNPHAAAVTRLSQILFGALSTEKYWVRVQATLGLENNFPEPDIAVVAGPVTSKGDMPGTALLVVEVSDTTIQMDRGKKMSLYASAGIGEYWIVNLNTKQVEVHTKPVRDAQASLGWRYEQVVMRKQGETISPSFAPSLAVAISQIIE